MTGGIKDLLNRPERAQNPPEGSSENMINRQNNWRYLLAKFGECIRDERGVAMTEYLLICGITVPLTAYLFHPNNGFYQAARQQHDVTTLMLMLLGP